MDVLETNARLQFYIKIETIFGNDCSRGTLLRHRYPLIDSISRRPLTHKIHHYAIVNVYAKKKTPSLARQRINCTDPKWLNSRAIAPPFLHLPSLPLLSSHDLSSPTPLAPTLTTTPCKPHCPLKL